MLQSKLQDMDDKEFQRTVAETLKELPAEFRSQLDNVEIVIEESPLDERGNPTNEFLGLYHGVPKTERNAAMTLPDKITLYKNVILSISEDIEEMKQTIRATVLHEIGHHFGLDDETLEKIESKKR